MSTWCSHPLGVLDYDAVDEIGQLLFVDVATSIVEPGVRVIAGVADGEPYTGSPTLYLKREQAVALRDALTDAIENPSDCRCTTEDASSNSPAEMTKAKHRRWLGQEAIPNREAEPVRSFQDGRVAAMAARPEGGGVSAKLTPLAVENLKRAATDLAAGGSGIIARRHADRPSLAALHTRGLLTRSVRRAGKSSADNAYTYHLSRRGLEALRELMGVRP